MARREHPFIQRRRGTFKRVSCDQCNLVRIQGVVCHETGCPHALRDERRECKCCDRTFTPEYRDQKVCGRVACRREWFGMI